jgi:hypothetical protein
VFGLDSVSDPFFLFPFPFVFPLVFPVKFDHQKYMRNIENFHVQQVAWSHLFAFDVETFGKNGKTKNQKR